ncbi:GTP-binding protein [Rubinisphaera margarita]|uniref:GTP-binding protein n=1 Tax=Rubinisphaera margarita TaxID=2909586 RepID=UPI001EE90F12|nr:GTP-binding protein [Rubinisphaera margarita]MCG6157467.1 cobalamin biosynthesis protein P47K [Rubinisphaera margarita]
MSDPIRYVMVGGFLGAGKTTTLARLAGMYRERGLNVGIVTNDQAEDLVDTGLLRSMGYNVEEVAGACFCCNFDELMDRMQTLGVDERPDIILAEPVGSCTDLVATVIQPLKHLFGREFEVAPYMVILKPSHGKKILSAGSRTGFSPKAEYILKKQLEEADAILINRCDELSAAEADELEQLLNQFAPGTPVLRGSAVEGTGFDGIAEFLEQKGDFGQKILDIDYDVYAEGEAELGWLNCSVRMRSEATFELDAVLVEIVEQIRAELLRNDAEPAHLKTIGLWEGFFGVANLISSDSDVRLSLPSGQSCGVADVIVNARVACSPELLEQIVTDVLKQIGEQRKAELEFRQLRSFRPGRPEPTHRYSGTK